MVSPVYQEGYPFGVFNVAGNGESAVVAGYANVAGEPGEGEEVPRSAVYLDRRGSSGWGLVPLNAPLSAFVGQIPVAYEAETGVSLWIQHTPHQPAPTRGLYVRSAGGVYGFVGPLTPGPESEEESSIIENRNPPTDYKPIAGTVGYSHVVMSQEPSSGDYGLYEYSGLENKQPVAVNVNGAEKGSTALIGNCAVLGGNFSGKGSEYNALSADGERVFFTAPCSGAGTEIYMREHGSLTSPAPAKTVEVSKSECSEECGSEVSGKNFEGASEDGGKVFFTSTQKLTNNAVDETESGDATEATGCFRISTGCNLYEYDLGGHLSAIGDGSVVGVSAIARDGSRVYFVAKGKLTVVPRGGVGGVCLSELSAAELTEEEATKEGRCRPKKESDNLYVYDSANGSIEFIATLNPNDSEDWLRAFERPVEVTGEGGRFLLFASVETGLTADDENTKGIVQLYEYDAVTNELVRVTKGEDGYNDNGNNAAKGIRTGSIANKVKPEGAGTVFRSLSDLLNVSGDGRTVVFETAGMLSGRAVSAADGCTSVYEFRSGGAISQGSVHLISDGQDVQQHEEKCGAEFAHMDVSGANILFLTADSLLAGDVDGGQRDVYDAREGGGFAPGPVSIPECQGEGCLGAFSSPPAPAAPGSLSQAPEAPVSAPVTTSTSSKTTKKKITKCVKGKKLSHGRCTKAKTKNKTDNAKRASLGRRDK
jgi:hypothetical protein